MDTTFLEHNYTRPQHKHVVRKGVHVKFHVWLVEWVEGTHIRWREAQLLELAGGPSEPSNETERAKQRASLRFLSRLTCDEHEVQSLTQRANALEDVGQER